MPNFPILANEDSTLSNGEFSRSGWNRTSGASLIDAQSDVDAVLTWLKEYDRQPRTQATYRKEAERFLLWASHKRGKVLSEITRDDVLDYSKFMANPSPDWCGPTRPRDHPDWRPFAKWKGKNGGLSPSSQRQAEVILSNLYKYLVEAGFLRRNPFALKRGRRKGIVTIHDEKVLDHSSLEFLMQWLDELPTETPREVQHAERSRWIIALYYYSAARLREVAEARMSNILLVRGRWWFKVHGKGDKDGEIPVSSTMLEALARYRQHLGLPAYPSPTEDTPLVCNLYHKDGPKQYSSMSAASLHRCVKEIMQKAAASAQMENKPNVAAQLSMATTHWLRHSSASHQLDAGVPLLVVSQNLRHSKLETTRRYLHTEDEARHNQTDGWENGKG